MIIATLFAKYNILTKYYIHMYSENKIKKYSKKLGKVSPQYGLDAHHDYSHLKSLYLLQKGGYMKPIDKEINKIQFINYHGKLADNDIITLPPNVWVIIANCAGALNISTKTYQVIDNPMEAFLKENKLNTIDFKKFINKQITATGKIDLSSFYDYILVNPGNQMCNIDLANDSLLGSSFSAIVADNEGSNFDNFKFDVATITNYVLLLTSSMELMDDSIKNLGKIEKDALEIFTSYNFEVRDQFVEILAKTKNIALNAIKKYIIHVITSAIGLGVFIKLFAASFPNIIVVKNKFTGFDDFYVIFNDTIKNALNSGYTPNSISNAIMLIITQHQNLIDLSKLVALFKLLKADQEDIAQTNLVLISKLINDNYASANNSTYSTMFIMMVLYYKLNELGIVFTKRNDVTSLKHFIKRAEKTKENTILITFACQCTKDVCFAVWCNHLYNHKKTISYDNKFYYNLYDADPTMFNKIVTHFKSDIYFYLGKINKTGNSDFRKIIDNKIPIISELLNYPFYLDLCHYLESANKFVLNEISNTCEIINCDGYSLDKNLKNAEILVDHIVPAKEQYINSVTKSINLLVFYVLSELSNDKLMVIHDNIKTHYSNNATDMISHFKNDIKKKFNFSFFPTYNTETVLEEIYPINNYLNQPTTNFMYKYNKIEKMINVMNVYNAKIEKTITLIHKKFTKNNTYTHFDGYIPNTSVEYENSVEFNVNVGTHPLAKKILDSKVFKDLIPNIIFIDNYDGEIRTFLYLFYQELSQKQNDKLKSGLWRLTYDAFLIIICLTGIIDIMNSKSDPLFTAYISDLVYNVSDKYNIQLEAHHTPYDILKIIIDEQKYIDINTFI